MPKQPEFQKYLETEWKAKRLTRPKSAIEHLIRSPAEFLREHPIVNTFDCRAHGTTKAYLRNGDAKSLRPGKVISSKYHTTEAFNIEMVNKNNAYGECFHVHGIYTGRNEPDWYPLGNYGPSLMLTAKLTGCTFVVKAGTQKSTTLVTHVQPHQQSGLELNERLEGTGRVAFGRKKYNYETHSVNIIGVRQSGRWKIWAQTLQKNSKHPRILSLRVIWPA